MERDELLHSRPCAAMHSIICPFLPHKGLFECRKIKRNYFQLQLNPTSDVSSVLAPMTNPVYVLINQAIPSRIFFPNYFGCFRC
jgi:hypothetical protein